MLEWARSRSGIDDVTLAKSFKRYPAWVAGETRPTWKQLQGFAKRTHTPFGYFLLDEPPEEKLPITDFRTIGDRAVDQMTSDLLDTVYQCQRRQEWYRDHQRHVGEDPLPFVGSATTATPIDLAARQVRELLDWTSDARDGAHSWTATLTELREHAECAGVLVMISGVVGANTHRPLDPDEFRGLALADPYAPVVFVNGRDSKAAQVFTLVHELAHLWLGADGVSDLDPRAVSQIPAERWCNRVAAEVLVPMDEFRLAFDAGAEPLSQGQRLAEQFRVSTEVILGRVREAGFIDWDRYFQLVAEERRRIAAAVGDQGRAGGNFYNTRPVQVSKRFARTLIASALEGRTLYTDAFRLLDVTKQATFDGLSRQLGVA